MSEDIISCPRCDPNRVAKNGFNLDGNQNFKCEDCNRQFVLDLKNKVIEQETKDLIDELLLEKLPLALVC